MSSGSPNSGSLDLTANTLLATPMIDRRQPATQFRSPLFDSSFDCFQYDRAGSIISPSGFLSDANAGTPVRSVDQRNGTPAHNASTVQPQLQVECEPAANCQLKTQKLEPVQNHQSVDDGPPILEPEVEIKNALNVFDGGQVFRIEETGQLVQMRLGPNGSQYLEEVTLNNSQSSDASQNQQFSGDAPNECRISPSESDSERVDFDCGDVSDAMSVMDECEEVQRLADNFDNCGFCFASRRSVYCGLCGIVIDFERLFSYHLPKAHATLQYAQVDGVPFVDWLRMRLKALYDKLIDKDKMALANYGFNPSGVQVLRLRDLRSECGRKLSEATSSNSNKTVISAPKISIGSELPSQWDSTRRYAPISPKIAGKLPSSIQTPIQLANNSKNDDKFILIAPRKSVQSAVAVPQKKCRKLAITPEQKRKVFTFVRVGKNDCQPSTSDASKTDVFNSKNVTATRALANLERIKSGRVRVEELRQHFVMRAKTKPMIKKVAYARLSLPDLSTALAERLHDKLGQPVAIEMVDKNHAKCLICQSILSLGNHFKISSIERHFRVWHIAQRHRCSGSALRVLYEENSVDNGRRRLCRDDFAVLDFTCADADVNVSDNLQCVHCGKLLSARALALHFEQYHLDSVIVPECGICIRELVLNARLAELMPDNPNALVTMPDVDTVQVALWSMTFVNEQKFWLEVKRRLNSDGSENPPAATASTTADDAAPPTRIDNCGGYDRFLNGRTQLGSDRRPRRLLVNPALRQVPPPKDSVFLKSAAASRCQWQCKLCDAKIVGAVASAQAILHYKAFHPECLMRLQAELCNARLEHIANGSMELLSCGTKAECLLCETEINLHKPYNLCRVVRHLKERHPMLMPESTHLGRVALLHARYDADLMPPPAPPPTLPAAVPSRLREKLVVVGT